jgi:hypothetical protein
MQALWTYKMVVTVGGKQIVLSKEDAIRIAKQVMGPPRREIVGEEREHLLLLLRFIEPVEISNNQRSITEVYHHADKVYHIHYWAIDDCTVEEVEKNLP